ncbi:MAG TPA: metallophosphoesterase, partial [Candidatus Dormibacteraeota bacterium]|nr:metallophosphoesterase [Candidatus Dormibacteraeota bacterium]
MTVDTIQSDLPILVVGDVHGDLERLFKALTPYPAETVHTVFLGDLVDGGPFGVGALRYARDRPNTTLLLGNHEVAMLRAIRDRDTIASWMGMGGQTHDLQELAGDLDLQDWLKARPAVVRLPDRTIAQHSDNDGYRRFLSPDTVAEESIEMINSAFRHHLSVGDEEPLLSLLNPQGIFRNQPFRLDAWLTRLDGPRLIHGHTPHRAPGPDRYAGGKAICFDGG